ncbi:MAG: chloride channel protein [Crocinitomicaceae bacterium]|nr:chloride channel protein [Crocinitomicaceae bacterium]
MAIPLAKKWSKGLRAFLVWRTNHIKNKPFVLILSVVIGFLCAVAAYCLKQGVHLVESFFVDTLVKQQGQTLFFLLPIIGIIITTLLIKYVIREDTGHGIPNTLYALSKGNGLISLKRTFSSVITAAFTVGFGGSCGLEGPAVGTTSAIGSNMSKSLRLNVKTRKLMIGCGAAAALSAIFKAPVAAIVFAMEVILLDITTFSLIPLLLSSVTAALFSRLFFGDALLFEFDIDYEIKMLDIPYYLLLGLLGGFVGVYFTRVYFLVSTFFGKIKRKPIKIAIGGLSLGALLYLFPPLYGEGYGTLHHLIENVPSEVLENSQFSGFKDNIWVILGFLALVIVFKAFATTITFGAGGVGGIFAPTLFMGSIMGFVFSRGINELQLGSLSVGNFSLVGMAALMAGILQAPLTAIFLIAEITGGYDLFIPLMITTSISFITVKYFTQHSVYTMQLAKKGHLITHDKDQAVLTLMDLKNEIETNFKVVGPYDTLGDLVKQVTNSKRNLFPVVDENKLFIGVVTLDDIREIMFDQYMYERTMVHELMSMAPEHIEISDSMKKVMEKFEGSGAWNLPVIDQGKYIGFVSKSRLYSEYRKKLKDFYQGID